MPDWLEAVLLLVVGGGAGYLGHIIQAKTGTKDNALNLQAAKRKEALDDLKWAAELAVSDDEGKRRLGVDQLQALTSNPYLEPDDLRRVRVAIQSALHPKLDEIGRVHTPEVRLQAPPAEGEQR